MIEVANVWSALCQTVVIIIKSGLSMVGCGLNMVEKWSQNGQQVVSAWSKGVSTCRDTDLDMLGKLVLCLSQQQRRMKRRRDVISSRSWENNGFRCTFASTHLGGTIKAGPAHFANRGTKNGHRRGHDHIARTTGECFQPWLPHLPSTDQVCNVIADVLPLQLPRQRDSVVTVVFSYTASTPLCLQLHQDHQNRGRDEHCGTDGIQARSTSHEDRHSSLPSASRPR